MIRTPDQRLRVFVSSTLEELDRERRAAREAITHLRLVPVMFEIGARPHPPRDLYRAYVDQSHVFVGIYWQSYGWTAPESEISGLDDEYHLAAGRPRLLYVKEPAPDIAPRLAAFLDEIRNDGEASYKGFTSPEELRELLVNDLALLLTEHFELATRRVVPLPPGRASDRARLTCLPRSLGPLIGRADEIAAAKASLLGDVTLLTLTGPGGTGKTRLALHVAAELADRFEHGVCFLSLAPVVDPALVPSAIAEALDVREAGDQPVDELVLLHLRERELLLVIDNFEHVIEASIYVSRLRDACPGVKILVTSRSALSLNGERELPVPPLALPDEHVQGLPDVARSPAVELFVRRSRDVRPDFLLTEANAAAVAEICRRLDGLPLAIELAAARAKVLDPRALRARLDSRLRLLTTGRRDQPERQRTLRNAIGWSYDLLSEDEQRLFRRISIFIGGFRLAAAEAVCDDACGYELLDGLASLVDKSLLGESEDPDGEPRFLMLETIREYGLDCLAEHSELPEVGRAHARYYVSLAETAEPELKVGPEAQWLDLLELEHDNMRAALDWAVEMREAELGQRLGGSLWRFWVVRGHLQEGRGRLESLLALSLSRTQRRAKALTALGVLARTQGDYACARAALEESEDIGRALGHSETLAFAVNNLGTVYLLEENYARAEVLLGQSLEIWRELEDQPGMVGSLNNLGVVAIARREFSRAHGLFEEVLAINRELGSARGEALALGNLALTALHREDFSGARPLLLESLALFGELRDEDNIAAVLMGLAAVAADEGDLERAAQLSGAAEVVRESIGAPISPLDRESHERTIAAVESGLDAAVAATAWAAGRRMRLDDAVTFALAHT